MSVDVDDQGVSLGDPHPLTGEEYEDSTGRGPVTDDGGMGDRWEATDEAPYGINPKTGRPYTMSADKRAEMGRRLAEGRRAAMQNGGPRAKRRPAGKGGPPGRPKAPRAPQGPDYRLAVAGLLQLPMMGLGVAARFNPTFGLDAAALALHTPAIADAVHQVAMDDARVAAILERVMSVGPYGALVAAVSPLILQILCNHGMVKPNETLGTMAPDDLLVAIGVEAGEQE